MKVPTKISFLSATDFHDNLNYFNHTFNQYLKSCSLWFHPSFLTHWHTFSELMTYIMTGNFHPHYPPPHALS